MSGGLNLLGASGPAPDLAPPHVPLEPWSLPELHALTRSGEGEAERCEQVLAQSARVQAALELAIAEGLAALEVGDRLLALGFSRLEDYAREVLDLRERTTQALVHLERGLRTRPLLRAAILAGEVRVRHAQTVLPVAVGEAEARWVARARSETVRALEAAVREARGSGEAEDAWTRLRVGLSSEDRATVDEALAVAGKVLPGSSRAERLEAMAQEYLGGHARAAGDPCFDGVPFRPEDDRRAALEARLEGETDRWSYLAPVLEVPAPATGLDGLGDECAIDARLRALASQRAGWDALVGHCAWVVKRSGLWRTAGFGSFEQYCKERLGLAARTVEQRAALERRLWQTPALRAARDFGVPYEKLRLLARLPDRDVPAWVARAGALTVADLRAALDDDDDAQMRAARTLRARVPLRVALLLAAAFGAVRVVEGGLLDDGRCLVRVARHFLEVWKPLVKKARTASQKVRERDLGRCQVPGCSRRAAHSHHIVPRSRGGSDDPANLVALCGLCRERHNAHYADCLLMPRRAVEALCRTHFGAADAA